MSIFDELARSGGYYNARDMFDGGGAMARGGRFQGGGLLSLIGNLANSLAGRDMGERSEYFAKKPMQRPMPMQNNAVQMVSNNRGFDPTDNQIAAPVSTSNEPLREGLRRTNIRRVLQGNEFGVPRSSELNKRKLYAESIGDFEEAEKIRLQMINLGMEMAIRGINPSAFPVADVDSPINTAKVTPQQSQIQEIATNIVADEMGVGFFTAPLVERQRLVQNKINELTIAMGM